MNIKELKEKLAGKYEDIEVYNYTDRTRRLHTDFIKYSEEQTNKVKNGELDNLEIEVTDYELMDEEYYNSTINANCNSDDFAELYDDKNAKILVIMLNEEM